MRGAQVTAPWWGDEAAPPILSHVHRRPPCRRRHRPRQLDIDDLWMRSLPATLRGCRESGPVAAAIRELGMCPMFRCRHNLALWVREGGSIKVEAGHVRGGTLRGGRPASARKIDRLAEAAVALGDRLGTLCVFDLLPDMPVNFGDGEVYMNHVEVGVVLGQSKESSRKIVGDAEHALDIAERRLARVAMRSRAAEAADTKLVQIRKRPVR